MNKLFDCCKNKKKRSVVLNWTTRTPWVRCLRMRLVFCLENRVQLELIYSQFNAWHQEIVWKRRRQRFDVIIGAGFFSLEAVWISPWKAAKPLHILQCLSDWFYLHLMMRHTLRCKWASSSCLFFFSFNEPWSCTSSPVTTIDQKPLDLPTLTWLVVNSITIVHCYIVHSVSLLFFGVFFIHNFKKMCSLWISSTNRTDKTWRWQQQRWQQKRGRQSSYGDDGVAMWMHFVHCTVISVPVYLYVCNWIFCGLTEQCTPSNICCYTSYHHKIPIV